MATDPKNKRRNFDFLSDVYFYSMKDSKLNDIEIENRKLSGIVLDSCDVLEIALSDIVQDALFLKIALFEKKSHLRT